MYCAKRGLVGVDEISCSAMTVVSVLVGWKIARIL